MTTHAVIYTRFSPRRDAEEALSCETQEVQCHEYLVGHGWEFRSAHADEAVSGKTELENRPGLMAAIAALHRGDVLLVYRRDRLARDAFLAEVLRRMVAGRGARIEAVSGEAVRGDDESPEARFVRGVLDLVAQLERELGAARTKQAMLTQQRGGRRMSRHPPYGKMLDPANPERWIDNPEEQPAVAAIRAMACEGLTAWKIARKLTLGGVRSRGQAWSARTVEKILTRSEDGRRAETETGTRTETRTETRTGTR